MLVAVSITVFVVLVISGLSIGVLVAILRRKERPDEGIMAIVYLLYK